MSLQSDIAKVNYESRYEFNKIPTQLKSGIIVNWYSKFGWNTDKIIIKT